MGVRARGPGGAGADGGAAEVRPTVARGLQRSLQSRPWLLKKMSPPLAVPKPARPATIRNKVVGYRIIPTPARVQEYQEWGQPQMCGVSQKGPGRVATARAHLQLEYCDLFYAFTVHGDVQALALLIGAHPQSDGQVDHLEDDQAGDEAVDQRGADAPQLRGHRTVHAADLPAHQRPGQQGADDAADTVDPEGIQRIVIA